MHTTTTIETKTCGTVTIHHNADWSGDVVVHWECGVGGRCSMQMPAALVLIVYGAIMKRATQDMRGGVPARFQAFAKKR